MFISWLLSVSQLWERHEISSKCSRRAGASGFCQQKSAAQTPQSGLHAREELRVLWTDPYWVVLCWSRWMVVSWR